jgi:MFS transporter, NNP family, nitrate/nitrite transporter
MCYSHGGRAGYGPRKVMASVLILGAIPSGLAGTVKNVTGLYLVRFFIGE